VQRNEQDKRGSSKEARSGTSSETLCFDRVVQGEQLTRYEKTKPGRRHHSKKEKEEIKPKGGKLSLQQKSPKHHWEGRNRQEDLSVHAGLFSSLQASPRSN
jgi:hypothetical protein